MSTKIFLAFILFITVCKSSLSQSQTWKNIDKAEMRKQLQLTRDWNSKAESYSVIITHTSFPDYTSKVPVEKINGYFHKNNTSYNSSLAGIQTIQNGKCGIYIDSSNRVMLINKPEKEGKAPMNEMYSEAMLEKCTSIKMLENKTGKRFRLEFEKAGDVSSCEIGMNKDGSYNEIVLFYAQAIKKKQSDPESTAKKPRLEIRFTNYVLNAAFNYQKEFAEENYFIYGNDKNPVGTGKFKEFKINDQRIKQNKYESKN
jgi:hypothetical protein